MTVLPHLVSGSLVSGFQGQAANDKPPLPHEILQEAMDECLHHFIHDFDLSMRSLLAEMNFNSQLEKQNTRSDHLAETTHLEISVGEPIPLDLWQMAVTSYHDQMLQEDVERFKTIIPPMDKDAMAHTMATGRYQDQDSEHESMQAFSCAYAADIKVFALARDLFHQNIPGVNIAFDMHQPAVGSIVPVMVITPTDSQTDLRMLFKNYVDSKQGKRRLSLASL